VSTLLSTSCVAWSEGVGVGSLTDLRFARAEEGLEVVTVGIALGLLRGLVMGTGCIMGMPGLALVGWTTSTETRGTRLTESSVEALVPSSGGRARGRAVSTACEVVGISVDSRTVSGCPASWLCARSSTGSILGLATWLSGVNEGGAACRVLVLWTFRLGAVLGVIFWPGLRTTELKVDMVTTECVARAVSPAVFHKEHLLPSTITPGGFGYKLSCLCCLFTNCARSVAVVGNSREPQWQSVKICQAL
jgi:hypothetical protein